MRKKYKKAKYVFITLNLVLDLLTSFSLSYSLTKFLFLFLYETLSKVLEKTKTDVFQIFLKNKQKFKQHLENVKKRKFK